MWLTFYNQNGHFVIVRILKTFQYTRHGDHIPIAVQPVEMEKRPKVELALVEYVLLLHPVI